MKFMESQLNKLKFDNRRIDGTIYGFAPWEFFFMGIHSTVIEDEIIDLVICIFGFRGHYPCQDITEIDQWRGNT